MNFGLIADVTGCRIVRLCFVLTFVVYNTDIFHDTANNTCDNFKASIVYFELSHKFSDIFFACEGTQSQPFFFRWQHCNVDDAQ